MKPLDRVKAARAANDAAWARLELLKSQGASEAELNRAHMEAVRTSGALGLVEHASVPSKLPPCGYRQCSGCDACSEAIFKADQHVPGDR